jgi:hypothetical protein
MALREEMTRAETQRRRGSDIKRKSRRPGENGRKESKTVSSLIFLTVSASLREESHYDGK